MAQYKTYTEAEIVNRLTGKLQHWRLENGHICRRYQTDAWKTSLMVVNTIGHLAEAAWHHPDLEVSFPAVVVKLQTHDAGGITDLDFELAIQIEQVVQWQPGAAEGALPGPPGDNPQFRYLRYD
ncbi:MAG: 4a-hydroxytetrahydrobiopterin dehydratase [Burkholderiaceae bacterium]